MSIFSILVGLGATLAVFLVVQSVPRWQSSRWLNASLLVLLGALVGARLLYVAAHWSFYRSHLLQAAAVWQGGFFWPGAVLGGLLIIAVIAVRWGASIAKVGDALAPMLPPLVISAWLAGWMGGYAYGALAPEGAFWGVPALDELGNTLPRFPLQIIAAVVMLVYAFILEMRKAYLRADGQKAVWMLFGLALNMAVFMPLRADPGPEWLGLPLHTWAAGGLFVVGAGMLLWSVRSQKQKAAA